MLQVREQRGAPILFSDSVPTWKTKLFRILFMVGYAFNWIFTFLPSGGYLSYVFGYYIFLINFALLPLVIYLLFLMSEDRFRTKIIVFAYATPIIVYELMGLIFFLYSISYWEYLSYFPALIGILLMLNSAFILILLPKIKGESNVVSVMGLVITVICAVMLQFYFNSVTITNFQEIIGIYYSIMWVILVGIGLSGLGMIVKKNLNLSGIAGILLGVSTIIFIFVMITFVFIRYP